MGRRPIVGRNADPAPPSEPAQDLTELVIGIPRRPQPDQLVRLASTAGKVRIVIPSDAMPAVSLARTEGWRRRNR